jgi:hypothetical protein
LPGQHRAGVPAQSILMFYPALRFSALCFFAIIVTDALSVLQEQKANHTKITIFRDIQMKVL